MPQAGHNLTIAKSSIQEEFQRANGICASYIMEVEDRLRSLHKLSKDEVEVRQLVLAKVSYNTLLKKPKPKTML